MSHEDAFSDASASKVIASATKKAMLNARTQKDGFLLADVAQTIGLSEQMIVNLINRYHIINPIKRRKKNRLVYVISPEEYEILQQIQTFIEDGYLLGQAIQAVEQQTIYRAHKDSIRQALLAWLQTSESLENKNRLVATITAFLREIDEQTAVMFEQYHLGATLFESSKEANLSGRTRKQKEKTARLKLQDANAFIGSLLTTMIKELGAIPLSPHQPKAING